MKCSNVSFKTLYGDQSTLTTQRMKPNYLNEKISHVLLFHLLKRCCK